jgi:tetratricopeptide (TPR) repeat protein
LYLLERFLQMAPNNSRWNYDYAFSTHRLRKDLQKALHYYDMALQNGFDEFWVRYNRGILFKELGDLENARVDFQQALTLNPDHNAAQRMLHDIDETNDSKQLHLALSQVQEFISNSEHGRASVRLEELLKKFPCNAELNYLFGFCLHVLKRDLDKALSYYTIALENGFDEFWIKYNRGILLHNLGNKDAALADLECALKLRPDHKGPEIVLRQLRTELYYGNDDK